MRFDKHSFVVMFRHAWLLAALAMASSVSAAPVFTGNADAFLTGVLDLPVNGRLYDVSFVRDSCAAVYHGCDQPTDFTFTTRTDALAASQALIDLMEARKDTVLTQFPSLCGTACMPLTPYAIFAPLFGAGPVPLVEVTGAFIPFVVGNGAPLQTVIDAGYVYTATDYYLIAKWSPAASVVPIPDSLALFLSGLLVVMLYRFRSPRSAGADPSAKGFSPMMAK